MTTLFTAGAVSGEVLDGRHDVSAVPPSQWRGDREERPAKAVLANLIADDGLRVQVSLLQWEEGDEVSLGHAELFAGPADYERLEDAGGMSPKLVGDKLVARVRALRYGDLGRARSGVVAWDQIDRWAGADAQELAARLGATRTGTYGDLLPSATRFKSEPAIEVPLADPTALFALYALTRVMPIMMSFGKDSVEGPHA